MKRVAIFGFVFAASLAVIAAMVWGWRAHRAKVPRPVAQAVPAIGAPFDAPSLQTPATPAPPILPPPAARAAVIAPVPPPPGKNRQESATQTERPDLMREERNREKAVDLFAERTMQLEDRFSDDPNADEARQTRALHQFRNRDEDDNADEVERAIGDHLREWIAGFPPEVADRLVLVSVECRIGACRILIADMFIDMAQQATVLGGTALESLEAQPWWQQEFIGHDFTFEAVRDQPGGTMGHALVTIFVPRREASE